MVVVAMKLALPMMMVVMMMSMMMATMSMMIVIGKPWMWCHRVLASEQESWGRCKDLLRPAMIIFYLYRLSCFQLWWSLQWLSLSLWLCCCKDLLRPAKIFFYLYRLWLRLCCFSDDDECLQMLYADNLKEWFTIFFKCIFPHWSLPHNQTLKQKNQIFDKLHSRSAWLDGYEYSGDVW